MKDQVTTIEQSRRLMELGVPAEKASMVRIFEDNEAEVLGWEYVTEQNGKYYMNELAMDELVIGSDCPVEVYCRLYDAESGHYDHAYRKSCPAYTVADLLEKVLPDSIATHNNTYVLTLGAMVGGGRWCVEYTPVLTELEAENIGDEFVGDLIALLCDRCEWLVSNGYKLNV